MTNLFKCLTTTKRFSSYEATLIPPEATLIPPRQKHFHNNFLLLWKREKSLLFRTHYINTDNNRWNSRAIMKKKTILG